MNPDRRGVDTGKAGCARFDAVLPELIGIDGEEPTLSPAEKEALLRHAETCPRCADSRLAYGATVDLLRGLPRKSAPADFLGWVRADLPETEVTSLPRRRPWKPWLAIAAAVPLAAAAVIYLASVGGDRPGPEIARAPALPSQDRPGEAAVPPAESRAELQELDATRDLDTARFDEVARSPPGEVIVLALPYIAGKWESDLASLEREIRGRFVDPPRNGATASRRATSPGFGSPRGSAAAPASAPEAREIIVSVDPARIPELRSYVDGWSASRLRKQMRGAAREPALRVEERLEAAPRLPVTIRIRVEPLPRPASPDPKSP